MIDFKIWPPSALDLYRLDGYSTRELIYNSRHREAFKNTSALIPRGMRRKVYLAADWPRLIAWSSAAMLFGEAPIVEASNIDDQAQAQKLFAKTLRGFYEGCISAAYRGDAVLSLRIKDTKAGPQLVVEGKPASCYFIEPDPDNAREALSEALAWERQDAKGNWILRVDHHYPGEIYREAWLLQNNNWANLRDKKSPWNDMCEPNGITPPHLQRKNIQVPLSALYGDQAPAEYERTGIDRSLLFHVPNLRDDTSYFGESDYSEGIISLFDSFNERLTDIHRVVSRHASPKLAVPEGTLNKEGQVKASDMEVFEVPLGGERPSYVTWDGQLQAGFQELDHLADLILGMSRTAKPDWGKGQPISVDSSPAMKLLFLSPLEKTTQKRQYWDPAIKEILLWGSRLAAVAGVEGYQDPSGDDISLRWQDGLPQNLKEAVDIEAVRLQNKFTSVSSAIQRTEGVTRDVADREMAQIKADTPPPASSPGLPNAQTPPPA